MPLDASVFDRLKTFDDYNRADQEFQLRKAVAAQALHTGGIDAASKANIYKTQLLSGAAAGGQSAYDQAKQTLQGMGIDSSEYAPDVGTAGQQLQQARLAQSPLGPLLNAGLKIDANNISAVTAAGGSDAAKNLFPGLPIGVSGISAITGGIKPATTPTANVAPQPADPRLMGAQQARMLPASGIAPVTPAQVTSTLDPSGANIPPVNVQAATNGTNLTPTGALPGTEVTPPAQTVTATTSAASIPKFVPPAYDPAKTKAANDTAVQQAFEQYKADPNYIRAHSQANKEGELGAVDAEAAAKGTQLIERLKMNLQAMKKLNADTSSAGFLPSSTESYFSQALAAHPMLNAIAGDNGVAANASHQWDQLDMQQVLSEIQQFIQAGGAGARINQTMEKMAKTASSINKEATPTARAALIDNALAEIENKNASIQNVVGGNQKYQPIPVQTSGAAAQPPTGATLYGTSGGKPVYKMPDGSFIMSQ